MRRPALLAALVVLHLAVSARALVDHSYLELYAFAFSGWPQFQIFVDLTVAVVLLGGFVARDARATGRNAWPYLLATFAVGSVALVAYFLVGVVKTRPRAGGDPAA